MFRGLLDKVKGCKYQITVKGLLRKDTKKKKKKRDVEFTPIYFNSTTKTVFNVKYDIDKSFQEV